MNKKMLGRAAGMIGTALAMIGSSSNNAGNVGLSEEGQMLRMKPEERLAYDRERRKRKTKIRQTVGFDYKKRNKKRRQSNYNRRINRS